MQIRTSQILPKKYNIFSRIDQLATYGTKCKQNEPLKKYSFVMSNLQLRLKMTWNYNLCFWNLFFVELLVLICDADLNILG